MRGIRLHRPSPAMAVALIALFVALGGSGYAAVKINGKNIASRSIAGQQAQEECGHQHRGQERVASRRRLQGWAASSRAARPDRANRNPGT